MRANGWKGDAVDAIRMSDGRLATMDNTRITAAREAGIKARVNIRDYNSPLPQDMINTGRFGNSKTWGEAVTRRINNQSGGFSKANPNGSYVSPKITGKP